MTLVNLAPKSTAMASGTSRKGTYDTRSLASWTCVRPGVCRTVAMQANVVVADEAPYRARRG